MRGSLFQEQQLTLRLQKACNLFIGLLGLRGKEKIFSTRAFPLESPGKNSLHMHFKDLKLRYHGRWIFKKNAKNLFFAFHIEKTEKNNLQKEWRKKLFYFLR